MSKARIEYYSGKKQDFTFWSKRLTSQKNNPTDGGETELIARVKKSTKRSFDNVREDKSESASR
jgi:hypothetical protein